MQRQILELRTEDGEPSGKYQICYNSGNGWQPEVDIEFDSYDDALAYAEEHGLALDA